MENKDTSVIIAITGGIGAGKSSVAELLVEMGYKVISLDERAKTLMGKNEIIKEQIKNQFGSESFLADGTPDSAFIGNLVFGSTTGHHERLLKLNSIVHPYVIQEMIDELEELTESGLSPIFVESALIFEADLGEGFDYIIVVDCPYDTAIERVVRRSGISREEALSRIYSQIPREEKVKSADFVINNNGTIEDLRNAVGFFEGLIKALPPKKFEILHEE